ncbi:MAG TPA: hypothetical protein VFO38_04755 [Candidatus Saccharimonadales bacterium]|nr:hypothetical protein [Candidatus Saccharimonadales bacterium]
MRRLPEGVLGSRLADRPLGVATELLQLAAGSLRERGQRRLLSFCELSCDDARSGRDFLEDVLDCSVQVHLRVEFFHQFSCVVVPRQQVIVPVVAGLLAASQHDDDYHHRHEDQRQKTQHDPLEWGKNAKHRHSVCPFG